MPFAPFLNYLSVTVKPEVAEGLDYKVNLNVENDGKYSMYLSNSTLKSYSGTHFKEADFTINLSRVLFEKIISKKSNLKAGQFSVSDQAKFQKMMSVFGTYELWFGVVTP
jgi:alkyl sulfatase BDS1-like metallo-beta-lactamase superfamily hydrolase